jgi:LAO/AO transport system kinase
VLKHRAALGPDGRAAKRAEQRWDFAWALVRDELESRLRRAPELAFVREDVRAGRIQAVAAADKIIDLLG